MEDTQSFRLIGGRDVVEIPVAHEHGQHIIYWEDIEYFFPGVKYVKNGNVSIPLTRDANRIR
jgi:hypothetical protein